MAKPNKTIFIDTNIFLHYRFFTEIDWPSVTEAGEVTIVIPPIIMRELEKHKYGQKDEALKRRAERVSAHLAQLFKSGGQVRPQTKITFERQEPDEEFSTHRLSRETQDDHLLASISLYKREHSEEDVLLISNDLPLEVKAAPLSIKTQALPNEYRQPTEIDPNVKRIRELEQELREFTNRSPKPELSFDNGLKRLEFRVPEESIQTRTVAERIEEIKRKYPKLEVPPPPPERPRPENTDPSRIVIYTDLSSEDKPLRRDIEKYNQALDAFYEEYEKYLISRDKAKELNSRKLELKIQFGNSGTAPVEKATIFMTIPASLQLTRNEQVFKYPQSPKPPELPEPRRYSALRDMYPPPRLADILPPSRLNTYVEPPNVERNNFSNDEDYHRVSFRVRHATHNLVYNCPYDLFIIFDSLENARSFSIEYQIIAANVPKPVDGKLHVIVKRDAPQEEIKDAS
jgi:hypothetical protein